ncbi:hypothetical protein Syun_018298 [Stephania yunnanensis]|uniref:Uncharacterized protein n=1 Tax=Stephania yunnanensis TaxID=152371 RepID=A0AAP0IS20_9MAGN
MDTEVPGKNVPQEVARELLIAISESVPDKALDSKHPSDGLNTASEAKNDWVTAEIRTSTHSPDKLNTANEANGCDYAEKFRSELISISYMQSPDVAVSP